MYSRSKTIALDFFGKEYNASSLDIRIISIRRAVFKIHKGRVERNRAKKVPDMSQDEIHDKAMEIAFETERQLSMEKKPMEGSSASATTQAG